MEVAEDFEGYLSNPDTTSSQGISTPSPPTSFSEKSNHHSDSESESETSIPSPTRTLKGLDHFYDSKYLPQFLPQTTDVRKKVKLPKKKKAYSKESGIDSSKKVESKPGLPISDIKKGSRNSPPITSSSLKESERKKVTRNNLNGNTAGVGQRKRQRGSEP